jgi:heptosyltransferase-3
MPPGPSAAQSLALGARLSPRYDLAISAQGGDRPTSFAIVAGRVRVAPVNGKLNGRVKGALLDRSVPVAAGVYRVGEMLRLADVLGIARVPELVAPAARDIEGLPDGGCTLIHAAPMFRYMQWARDGWRKPAAVLVGQGLSVAATGGPGDDERRYLDDVWNDAKVMRLDGRLDWPQLAGLLAKARVYVGPDTSVTHLAAASGCPTVALFGPTDPCLWGPWPAGGLDRPWAASGDIQPRGNVFLVQHAFPCRPCQLEGCERRLGSHSACMDNLHVEKVLSAVNTALSD